MLVAVQPELDNSVICSRFFQYVDTSLSGTQQAIRRRTAGIRYLSKLVHLNHLTILL